MVAAAPRRVANSVVSLDETLSSLGLDEVAGNAVPGVPANAPKPDIFTQNAKIMIIDDEPYNVLVVKKFLQHSGYSNFLTLTESDKALRLIREEMPDIVLLDVMMPGVSGLDILRTMKHDRDLAHIPVVILTASPESHIKVQALELGATDFLSKPVETHELVLRVRNVLAAKSHFDMLSRYSVELEEQVRRRTEELAHSRKQIIYCLARAAEFRDNDTGHHVIRVGKYAGLIAKEMGFRDHQVDALEQAAQLHDVGKIGIPDAILHKPGKLDPEEYAFMQRHCGFGNKIVSSMPEHEWNALKHHTELGGLLMNVKSSPVMRLASRVALTHHEWWNGTGYPLGLSGEDIPIEGRITAVADVFDALSSKRPYKQPFPREKCFAMLEEKRGTQFDPRVLDAFFRRSKEIVEVQLQYADNE